MFTAPSVSPSQLLFSSPDELNDPHRKPAKHKEYHYQSLLIKSQGFSKMLEICGTFSVFSATFYLLPDADGLIDGSRNVACDL